MTTCIIAEKPSVARDIARIVGANRKEEGYIEGSGYLVTWAIGHLVTLAMPEVYGFREYRADDLPILPNPHQLVVRQVRKDKEYHDDPSAIKQLKVIRHCFTEADQIIVATDAGREGELIFRYIYHYLGCQKPFQRLWISSLTDKAIQEGLAHLKSGRQYDNLYLSAKARSEADWCVGINASRALSIARRGGYSLGRVQTPTLAMICSRYLANKAFQSVPYWKLTASVSHTDLTIRANSQEQYDNEADAQSMLAQLRTHGSLTVTKVTRKVTETPPPLLYDLTALQKEANSRHGFSADKTLSIAQSLYEKKVTTYPRTGSRYISEDIFEEVPKLITKVRKQTIPTNLNRQSVDDSKVTDHHAIIPTGEEYPMLSADEQTIYTMIAHRFVEAFLPPSQEERMQVEMTDGTHHFVWKGQRPVSLGWKVVQDKSNNERKEGEEEELEKLPTILEGETLPLQSAELLKQSTKPKPLYTEATLLSAMEHAGKEVGDTESKKALAECGIGTPATRANIIETLILRDYVRREKKSLVPTDKGLVVYEIVKEMKIANAEMTGNWELSLTAIEAGALEIGEFEKGIKEYTRQICTELLALTAPTKQYPTYKCPKCGKESFAIYNKVAKCKDDTCGFKVFRQLCGTFLSDSNIQDLITKGKTPILKGMTSKAGKKFNARLVLREDFTTAFEFEARDKKSKK
ncbi:type IA DNA topoisomerase [Porphyromonas levii]|uniref:type IA DNA topoisomerase n=1 Tax=Porphyromonas levii TaxID=28114 RepID=UPI001B8B4241|nr:type IA DNA topoisomerase [Porphyromonas levii]MDN4754814.1 DNA topoisomerase 3 [Porphyromonadaceae bacterium W3.11]MBR8713644.1 DNA topoisomerase 3 [Porphyromonas levii]MBR8715617.1 DNA topoisomerase 3 [Porphyromonas levii]MBR8728191.1 DNA topoisomerase 3 [Porphyromonas levii]MBR8736545.1 DNA topoisomerase 3 [Porphyromonas levii]